MWCVQILQGHHSPLFSNSSVLLPICSSSHTPFADFSFCASIILHYASSETSIGDPGDVGSLSTSVLLVFSMVLMQSMRGKCISPGWTAPIM